MLIPSLSFADLTTQAQITYKDASGTSYAVTGNAVTVIISALGAPAPMIRSLNVPGILPINGTVQVITENAAMIHWTWTRLSSPAASSGFGSEAVSPVSGVVSNISTPNPILALTQLALSPGDYTLQVVAENIAGVQTAPAMASVTLVAPDLANVGLYPNPWRKDRHEGKPVTFYQLTGAADVKIFTVSGHLVKDLGNSNNTATWDLNNDSGDRVASGLYFYLITNNLGQQSRGKLAVIR